MKWFVVFSKPGMLAKCPASNKKDLNYIKMSRDASVTKVKLPLIGKYNQFETKYGKSEDNFGYFLKFFSSALTQT